MNTFNPEWIGYVASIVLVISFALKKVNHIRIVNSIACVLFVVYSLIINAYPVVIANGAIICLNLYYLFFADKKKQ